ncbi:sugar ABC transporter substrate-binding protein [Vagococcus sp. BWB3-3]|uniref:Sugar ABC transporter substrate-binding protein n=1 Tax=Vagococcus allomyrinae TaxID=2794353 RepID=A0A940PCM8_9ENTE|nr:sugar ABC transporter substrate-binding protein [Vagococcus allomyrinae]MBP1042504.1 sugar ABC transporter substrate-binding protein [Vagococcus allomyrinae]
MKKNVMSFIVAFGLLLTLGACSSSGDQASSESTTLTLSIWETYEKEGMEQIAEAFEADHPEIKVNVEVTPWSQYWTKLEAASTGGTAADIVTMLSSEFYNYAANGQLMNLGELVKNGDIDVSAYRPEIADLYTFEDELYTVPKDVDSLGLWYNKTLFDAQGLAYPDESWTWETLLETAKKLTDQEKGTYGFAAPNTGQDGYNSFVFQNGGNFLNDERNASTINQKNTVEALQWFVDLSTKEGVSPTDDQLSENDAVTSFQSGKVAMVVQGSWMTSQFRDNEYTLKNCDVAVLPKGKERATQMNGKGYAISAQTKHPEAAKKFITFLGSEEGMKIQAETGTAIPAFEGLGDAWVEASSDFNAQVFVDQLEFGVMKPYSKATKSVETAIGEGLREAFSGKKSVAELTPKIDKEINELLKAAE